LLNGLSSYEKRIKHDIVLKKHKKNKNSFVTDYFIVLLRSLLTFSRCADGKFGARSKMKKSFYLFCAVVAGALLTSCSTSRTTSVVTTIDADNYVMEVTPMVATLHIEDTHVKGEFTWDGKKNESVNLNDLRDNAIFNALQKRKADVLVAPQSQTVKEIRGNRKYITVTVIGYPATYTNFQPAPIINGMEVKELKGDANYLIVSKDNKGNACGYQVVVPYEKDMKTLDLDQTTLDKVVLNGNNAPVKRAKRQPKVEVSNESDNTAANFFEKFTKKDDNKSSNKKKSKKK